MALSNALSAYNTLLKIGDGGGPEVFATIAEVFSIGGPALAGDGPFTGRPLVTVG